MQRGRFDPLPLTRGRLSLGEILEACDLFRFPRDSVLMVAIQS
jgi:hypothetical protein